MSDLLMKTLRERCDAMVGQLYRTIKYDFDRNAAVETLVEFVLAERGRTADPMLEPTLAVCLYFGTAADRDDFMAIAREAKPGMTVRSMP